MPLDKLTKSDANIISKLCTFEIILASLHAAVLTRRDYENNGVRFTIILALPIQKFSCLQDGLDARVACHDQCA